MSIKGCLDESVVNLIMGLPGMILSHDSTVVSESIIRDTSIFMKFISTKSTTNAWNGKVFYDYLRHHGCMFMYQPARGFIVYNEDLDRLFTKQLTETSSDAIINT